MEEQYKSEPDNSDHTQQSAHEEHQLAHDIKFTGEELKSRLTDDQKSLGLDLDGTNPGSRSHPLDYDSVDDES